MDPPTLRTDGRRHLENLAIRTVELFVDVYAKLHNGGSATPHHVSQVSLWSVAARNLHAENPSIKPKDYLRVEHGTPRRALGRTVMDLFHKNDLSERSMAAVVKQFWKLAVITVDEDARLNKIARAKMYDAPELRWAAADIRFPDDQ